MKKIPIITKYLLVLCLFLAITSCGDHVKFETEPEEQLDSTNTSRNFNISPNLTNPQADKSAVKLYNWMVEQFGTRIISGQTYQKEQWTYIEDLTGKIPIIRAYDMQQYSPRYSYLWDNETDSFTFGPEPDAKWVEKAIEWYNMHEEKPIIKFQWHWHSPLGGTAGTNTFYTEKTTFDVRKAVVEGTDEYNATIRDIDAIAVQLKKFRDAGIPVLWRPLHEIDGGWFWWSAHGPGPAKDLWDIMYDRLVNYHQLHNLIWMWNGEDLEWYVGNDKCDLVSIDSYPDKFDYGILEEKFDQLYEITNGTKMIGISENGAIPDMQEALDQNVPWAFFISWNDHLTLANSDQHITDIYGNPNVITLENYE